MTLTHHESIMTPRDPRPTEFVFVRYATNEKAWSGNNGIHSKGMILIILIHDYKYCPPELIKQIRIRTHNTFLYDLCCAKEIIFADNKRYHHKTKKHNDGTRQGHPQQQAFCYRTRSSLVWEWRKSGFSPKLDERKLAKVAFPLFLCGISQPS